MPNYIFFYFYPIPNVYFFSQFLGIFLQIFIVQILLTFNGLCRQVGGTFIE